MFRLKSFSDYVKVKKQIRNREREGCKEAKFLQWQKSKRVKKRTWKLRVSTLNLLKIISIMLSNCKQEDDDEDYRGHTRIDSPQKVDAFMPSSLEPTTVKPWNNPPEEPSAKFCGDYIRNLNPRYDVEPVAGFKRTWLSKVLTSLCQLGLQ